MADVPAGAEAVIRVAHLHKSYPLGLPRVGSLRGALSRLVRPEPPPPAFAVLRGVTFDVPMGQAVGLVGRNGAGKSTLLKILTGIIRADRGEAVVRGRISPLLELGAGFHPDFTGRENVRLNGALLGIGPDELESAFDDIVAFSGIGAFIDQPVRTYSSGMYLRLAFAVAVHTRPDVLIIDEALSVGDRTFKARCLDRLEAMLKAGATALVVSHDVTALRTLCDRVIWLEEGVVRMDGPTEDVLAAYHHAMAAEASADAAPPVEEAPPPAAAGGHEPLPAAPSAEPTDDGKPRAAALRAEGADGRPLEVVAAEAPFFLVFDWTADPGAMVRWRFQVRRVDRPAPLGNAVCASALMAIEGPMTTRARVSAEGLPGGRYEISVVALGPHAMIAASIARCEVTVAGPARPLGVPRLPSGWAPVTVEPVPMAGATDGAPGSPPEPAR